MLDRIKPASNPLSIIALFAGISEIACTTALAFSEPSIQGLFIWFVMGFPVLLILLFFLTLNFNNLVLYSPSDYKDENNFTEMVRGTHRIDSNLTEMSQQIEDIKKQLNQFVDQESNQKNKQNIELMSKDLSAKINELTTNIVTTKDEAAVIVSNLSETHRLSITQTAIINLLRSSEKPLSIEQISDVLRISKNLAHFSIQRLIKYGLLNKIIDCDQILYSNVY